MDRRTLLALALMAIVIIVTPLLFPSARRPVKRDSAAVGTSSGAAPNAATVSADTAAAPPTVAAVASTPSMSAPRPQRASDSVVVRASLVELDNQESGYVPARWLVL